MSMHYNMSPCRLFTPLHNPAFSDSKYWGLPGVWIMFEEQRKHSEESGYSL